MLAKRALPAINPGRATRTKGRACGSVSVCSCAVCCTTIKDVEALFTLYEVLARVALRACQLA